EKNRVGLRMTSGPAETPSDWMTTPTPLSARFTVAVARASPAIFSNFGWSMGIFRADRASPLPECPPPHAAFTVPTPIPLRPPLWRALHSHQAAPSARTDDQDGRYGVMLHGRTRLAHRHVRCSQPHRKMGERLETRVSKGALRPPLFHRLSVAGWSRESLRR